MRHEPLEMQIIRPKMNAVYELLLREHYLPISWFYRDGEIVVLMDKNTDPEQPYQRIGLEYALPVGKVKLLGASVTAEEVYEAYLKAW